MNEKHSFFLNRDPNAYASLTETDLTIEFLLHPKIILVVEVHRTGKFPSGRTGLIKAGYRILSLTISDNTVFRIGQGV